MTRNKRNLSAKNASFYRETYSHFVFLEMCARYFRQNSVLRVQHSKDHCIHIMTQIDFVVQRFNIRVCQCVVVV